MDILLCRTNFNKHVAKLTADSFRLAFIFSIVLGSFLYIQDAEAATYYVSPTGSNTSPYDTWEKAATLPATAVTAGNTDLGGDGPHIMYIAPGTYDSNISINDTDWVNGLIIGTSAHGSTNNASKNQVVLNKAAAHTLRVSNSGVTVKNVTLTGTDASHDTMYIDGTDFVGINLSLYDSERMLLFGGSGISLYNCLFRTNNLSSQISLNGGNISNSIFTLSPSQANGATGMIITGNGGVINFYNNTIIGGGNSVTINGTSILNLKNNIISAGFGTGSYAVDNRHGTANLENNFLGTNWYNTHTQLNGVINTDTNNIKSGSPLVSRYQRSGFVIPSVDDAVSYNYAKLLEAELASRGMKGTFFVEAYTATNNATIKSEIQGIIDRGVMSVGSHSYSHSRLEKTASDTAITITKAGANIAVSRSENTITVTPGGMVSGFKTKNLLTIESELEAMGATVTYGTSQSYYSLGEILNDASGTSPLAITYLIDTSGDTGFYKVEVKDAKDLLEANFTGLSPLMGLATPYGYSSANLQSAAATVGYGAVRSGIGGGAADHEYWVGNIDLMQLTYITNGFFVGLNDEETRTYVAALAEMVSQGGGIIFPLGHNTEEITMHQWGIILDELAKYPEIQVTSMDEAIDTIRNGGEWSTADNRTYTMTWTDQSDFNLQSTSPAIDSGTNVSLTTDYVGNPIYGIPDIGAYEYQPPFSFSAHDIPTTGAVRLYSDGKYRMTTASSTSAVANFSVTPSGGSYYTASTSQYMDITIDSWQTTGNKNKQWTATSTVGDFHTHATSTIYTIGDLAPNTYYQFKLDSTASSTAIVNNSQCTNGVCLSDENGQIVFTYQGGYSTHTFALEKDTTAPTGLSLSSPANNSSTSSREPSFLWSAATDSGSGLSKYQLYVDSNLNKDNISASAVSASPANSLSCGSHTWYVRAYDLQGNYSTSGTNNLYIHCNSGISPQLFTPPSNPATSAQNPTGKFKLIINDEENSTLDRAVVLTLLSGSDTAKMAISEDPGFMYASLEAYKQQKEWILSDGYGQKTIYAKFYTIHGQATSPVSATIDYVADIPDTATSTEPIADEPDQKEDQNPDEIPNDQKTDDGQPAPEEEQVSEKIVDSISTILNEAHKLIAEKANVLTSFITKGTQSTLFLGEGERKGVVESFKSAFGRAPKTEKDWEDVIKIATGRWPGQRDESTEKNAEAAFRKIYRRNPDMENSLDNAAITIISYGLRPMERNLESERKAIIYFKNIYGYEPKSATAWDIVRAIAYSGATR